MPRPQKMRRICEPPVMSGFRPYGLKNCDCKKIQMTYEEYESFKMVNYAMLSQDEAAEKMQVSRPTYTRIYNKALATIAKAFAEGLIVEITGGKYHFDEDWFRCKKCFMLIKGEENHSKCRSCECFGPGELTKLNQ